jgi:hypothetical protein
MMTELRIPLLGKHNISRPKSIWNKTGYLEEQANMQDFLRNVSRMAGRINPTKYIISGGTPKLKAMFSQEGRIEDYKKNYAKAMEALNKMGV